MFCFFLFSVLPVNKYGGFVLIPVILHFIIVFRCASSDTDRHSGRKNLTMAESQSNLANYKKKEVHIEEIGRAHV